MAYSTVATINTCPRAGSHTHSHTQAAGAKTFPFEMLTKWHEFNFKDFSSNSTRQHGSGQAEKRKQQQQQRNELLLLAVTFWKPKSETEPKLKLKLAHIQNIYRRSTLSFEWKWEWIIWNVQMLLAKVRKVKKRKLEEGLGYHSLSLSHSFVE